MSELLIAMTLALAVMVGAAQLMQQALRQQGRVEDQNLLVLEVANVMEDLMSRPWSEISTAEPPTVALSPACRQAVPDARLQVEIVPDEEHPDMRRISVRIERAAGGHAPAAPLCLVAWRQGP